MEKTQNYIENPLGTKPIKKLLTSLLGLLLLPILLMRCIV